MVSYVNWPDGVPPCVMPLGSTGGLVDTRYSFETESSIQPVQRPRTTWAPERYQVQLTPLSRNQLVRFQTWYREDLAYGTKAFKMSHPILRYPILCKIMKADPPYEVRKDRLLRSNDKRGLTVSFTIQTVPGSAGEVLAPYISPSGAAPSLILDFVNGFYSLDGVTSVSLPVTTARASAGTVWNASGKIETVAENTLRIDHDPETGERLGALVENASANVLPESHDFAAASGWSGAGDFTLTTATSIFAGATATKHENTTAGSRRRYRVEGVLTGSPETLSMWIEQGTASACRLSIWDDTAKTWVVSADYTWSTGTAVILIGAGTVKVTDLQTTGPNGGKLVRIDVTGTGTAGNSRSLYIYPTGAAQVGEYAYLHLVQHEEQEAGSSYIPTTTAQASRDWDQVLLSATDFPYNLAEGTWAARHIARGGSNWVSLNVNTRDRAQHNRYEMAAGPDIYRINVSPVQTPPSAYAMGADATGIALSIEGAPALISGTISGASSPPPWVWIGGLGSNATINGHFEQLLYWPQQRLPDSDLEALSA